MVGFIFGEGQAAKTPEELKRMRAIIASLQAGKGAPRNIGEGLNALGDGIVANVLNRRADSAESAGQEGFNAIFSNLFSSNPVQGVEPGSTTAAKGSDTLAGSAGGDALAAGAKLGDFDWSAYATGGATRPDSFSGMKPEFNGALQKMFASAPPDIQKELRVGSGYRSSERQTELWNAALKKYGSADAARKWVAPPGRSQHNHGNAADLKYLSPRAREWAHANASKFGLSFPLSNENWHIELQGARGNNSLRGGAEQDALIDPTNPYALTPQWMRSPVAAGLDALGLLNPAEAEAPSGKGDRPMSGAPKGDRLIDPNQRIQQALMNPDPQRFGSAEMPAQARPPLSPDMGADLAMIGAPAAQPTPPPATDPTQTASVSDSAGTPGEIRRGPDGQTYQYVETTGMQGATGPWGWIPVNAGATSSSPPQAIARALNRGGGGLSRAMFDDAGSAGNPAVQAALARQGGQPQPSGGNPLQAIAQALMGGGQPQQAPAPAPAPQAAPMPQQAAPQQGGDRLQQLVMAASNPWATDEQRALIGMEIKRLQDEQDPLRQLQIQNAQAELEQKKRGVQAKAPDVQTFFDPDTGQEYKAQWNASSGQWDRIGGTKASKDGGLQVTLPDGTTVQQGSFDKQDAKNVANRVTEEQEAAAGGSALKQTVGLLREANQNVGYSGPGAGIYGGVDNALEGVGMPSLPGNSGARAVMTSGGLEVALGQVQKTKGAISNAEMGLFMAAAPGLANTPQGNAALFDMIDAIADRQIERAAAIETYRQQHGGSLDGFEKQWSDYINANPLILKGDGGGIRLNIGPRREQGAPTADNDPLGIRGN